METKFHIHNVACHVIAWIPEFARKPIARQRSATKLTHISAATNRSEIAVARQWVDNAHIRGNEQKRYQMICSRWWLLFSSQIWDSKILSRITWDSDPTKTRLARASSIYKRQTRSLAREGAPQKQDCNCRTVINIWGSTPRLIDWLTFSRNVTLTLT
jgi:hypothetical protein